ncbi:PEP-CTERM system histidine kinase PrsK [Psychromonas sp. psych-6C06]|uniref:XrtA/PEP-CTERM system histidine kinase PrsK n=1 Tax=Psychromonas sp. psych-6C06 TaxID=2058089 RepID=UPI000C3275E7|nr:XrtA/PEP-CTERM system histidine kinase PrsK [Psychromonas sp. psych-6C06]PKF61428.1 PEP-CTERM system histidine kinase PrsK [Psychromonas sp. psych-6C06]
MDFYQNTEFSNLLLGSVEIALAIVVFFKIHITRTKISFLIYALCAVVWHISLPTQLDSYLVNSAQLLIIEALRYLTLLLMLLCLLMLSRGTKLPALWSTTLFITIPVLIISFIYSIMTQIIALPFANFWLYSKMAICLLGIIICEQLLRHDHSSRMAKLIALAAFTIFAYDILVFSNLLLFAEHNQEIWHARGFVASATSLIMALTVIFYAPQLQQRGKFKLSNSVIIFNTSITLVGFFLLIMALLGSIFNYLQISWLNASTIMLYVLAIFSIIALSFSETARLTVFVWISKHFFAHKYDYKQQWMKLDKLLTQGGNSYEKSLRAMLTIFSCQSGAVWIKGPQFYSMVNSINHGPLANNPIQNNHTPFIELLEKQEWIFQPAYNKNEIDKTNNQHLPEWLTSFKEPWVIVPLNNEQELIGFMLLSEQRVKTELIWEDLDMLKLTGRQIASYISHQQAHEKLIQNQQFDIFNKITAFAIHDIKNLIAQQALVVKNAEKYKHHPEFVDDAIDTIANSVQKMDALLVKLQGKHRNSSNLVNINHLIAQAIEMNKHASPIPTLKAFQADTSLNVDADKLLMVLNHLIKNAQDATEDNGQIDIILRTDKEAIWLEVMDTGVGMSQAFINNKLFKPFDSTKQDNGMGLGAYQIREIIHSLEGQFFVESTLNIGSKFSIYIPKNANTILN